MTPTPSKTGRVAAYTRAYVRRAEACEAERRARCADLEDRARRIARSLRERFGGRVKVFLFGSLTDPDRFAHDSDIDLAVEGLSPTEYWDAWALAEEGREVLPSTSCGWSRLRIAYGP